MEEFKDKPVSFVSINTRNPKGQVDAELKKFKKKLNMNYPAYYGKGQNINRDFLVKKLPRLILINSDSTVYKDELFMTADELRAELTYLLGKKESGLKEGDNETEIESGE